MSKISLFFDKGTVLLRNVSREVEAQLPGLKWDERVNLFRAPASSYRDIMLALHERKIPFEDQAREFKSMDLPTREIIEPRPYQQDAMSAWWRNGRQGVVVLPTGAGKTILAVMLMIKNRRSTLIHVPTIDLMHQWHSVLRKFLDLEIGLWGGGYNETEDITISTYDSALLHVDTRGNQFGLLIFDECHRLPGDQYQFLAMSSIAPFRLGLTATPERADGREKRLYQLSGSLCYRANIHELTGKTLAPYEVFTIEVDMKFEEREAYEEASAEYLNFLQTEQISLGGPNGWKNFLYRASRTPVGRSAFKAWLRQKKLSQASAAKDDKIWELIQQHAGDRIIIFTQDNEMAYRIGKNFLLPVITHQTRLKERESFLTAFRNGDYAILATSKVLNEGVDVPEANVAIIVSGSGSVREHVQRLGRILRARPGKKAILYELISSDTREYYVNMRRKRHHAYQRPGSVQNP